MVLSTSWDVGRFVGHNKLLGIFVRWGFPLRDGRSVSRLPFSTVSMTEGQQFPADPYERRAKADTPGTLRIYSNRIHLEDEERG
jgi:hypothetical protein